MGNGMAHVKRRGRLVAGSLAFAFVSACGAGISGLAAPPPELYNLTPKSTFRSDLPKVDWQLVVNLPRTAGGLDEVRIAVREHPTRLQYFAGVRWTDRAPAMIQSLLVESFENSERIIAVDKQAIGLRSDFDLRSELREFQAEYFGENAPLVRVRVNVKLVKQPRRTIIASKSFEATKSIEGKGMVAITAAFDDALGKVLKGVVEWTLVTAK